MAVGQRHNIEQCGGCSGQIARQGSLHLSINTFRESSFLMDGLGSEGDISAFVMLVVDE